MNRMQARIDKLEARHPPGDQHQLPARIYLCGMVRTEAGEIVTESEPPLVMVFGEGGQFRDMTEAELVEWKDEYDRAD
jgi:hypothetical protein